MEWSTNEKVAFELLAGAFYAGARTLFTCKQVGLNVASDPLTVLFEMPLEGEARERCEQELVLLFKAKIGCTPEAKGVPMGGLPRSEKKTKRIFDSRY